MDRWLKLKRKNTEDVNEGASCSKQSDLIQKMAKCRKYDVEYLKGYKPEVTNPQHTKVEIRL
jgi:hypothetical protein